MGCKDRGIKISEFVGKTQFLYIGVVSSSSEATHSDHKKPFLCPRCKADNARLTTVHFSGQELIFLTLNIDYLQLKKTLFN